MTIRIYPSRLPGEPLEKHEHGLTTFSRWMQANVDGYSDGMPHPIAVEVNGKSIHADEWVGCIITPESDVRIYPVPYGTGLEVAAWIAVAVSVATAAYTLFFAPSAGDQGGFSSTSGSSLDLNPAKANTARLGDPVRELFGRAKIYPDYVVQPVTRFNSDDPTIMTVEMFICLGRGYFDFTDSDIKVGNTPVISLDAGFSYTRFSPGESVLSDRRSENWHNSTEVGGTASGTGLDMAQTAPTSDSIVAESATVSGASVTFNKLRTDDNGAITTKLPDTWVVGGLVKLIIPSQFTVTTSGAFSRISGNVLEEIKPYVGMPVTIQYSDVSYDLYIASYTPSSTSPTVVTASITLAYGSATGTAFNGLPTGTVSLSIGHRNFEYQIQTIDGTTITVKRMLSGVIDNTWAGFVARSALDFDASSLSDSDKWMGPFLACPDSEKIDMFEVNFSFPSGICGFSDKGKKKNRIVQWEIQYRSFGSGEGWNSKTGSYDLKNVNGLGFTERVILMSPALVEVRCRRLNEQGEKNARDNMYWQSLRGRLLSRPAYYSGVTTMGVTVETGGKLAAQSDRRVNIVATRMYDIGQQRSISGALYHVGESLGLEMDNDAISILESAYWTPKSETFDFATTESISALEMLQKIANAGKSYFILTDGLASVAREGVKPWTGIISPQEMIEDLQTAFVAPSGDDYDGVDVTYINGITWSEETVQCRLSDVPTPFKVEDYKLDGVTDRDRAYQIGMRRLMKYRQQRLTFTTTTELDAMCYNFGDRVVITDDIPGSKTISSLIEDMSTAEGITTFTVSEPLDWSFSNPRVLIRYQDGTASGLMIATKAGEYQVSVPYIANFDSMLINDPVIEPPRIIFCESSRVGYAALISEISPQSDGTCQVSAKEYKDSFYVYDEAIYPN